MYNNVFTTAAGGYFTAFFMRGGTGVICNNVNKGFGQGAESPVPSNLLSSMNKN